MHDRGNGGDDLLDGTNQADVICGLGGNDVIDGGNGNDTIYGGAGDDVIFGGGGNGADTLYGDEGADEIHGGGGVDLLVGGPGDDTLYGENGEDTLDGGGGNDSLFGGLADDDLTGGFGVDSADGGPGSDVCRAESTVECEEELPDEGGVTPEQLEVTSPSSGAFVFGVEQVAATVMPADSEGSVSLVVDGTQVGGGPTADGVVSIDWDTTTLADGEATLTVELYDAGGNLIVTVPVDVVVANDNDTSTRLQLDFEAGRLTSEEYVRYGLYSLTLPDLAPARYQVIGAEDRDPSTELLPYFVEFHKLTSVEQDDLTAYLDAFLTGDPALGDMVGIEVPDGLEASASGGPLTVAAGFGQLMAAIQPGQVVYDDGGVNLGGWRGCTDSNRWHPPGLGVIDHSCIVTVDRFEFDYTIDIAKNGSNDDEIAPGIKDGGGHGVRDDDDFELVFDNGMADVDPCPSPCNGIPDQVDQWAAALLNGWDSYDSIDMVDPVLDPETIRVIATDTGPFPAHVIPTPLTETTIVLNTAGAVTTEFDTRHELFHVMQYGLAQSLDVVDFAQHEPIKTFMEGSAQWGADFSGSNNWQEGRGRLDEFLRRTDDFFFEYLDNASHPDNKQQYGSCDLAASSGWVIGVGEGVT